jgi:hypothetical protein
MASTTWSRMREPGRDSNDAPIIAGSHFNVLMDGLANGKEVCSIVKQTGGRLPVDALLNYKWHVQSLDLFLMWWRHSHVVYFPAIIAQQKITQRLALFKIIRRSEILYLRSISGRER